MPRKRDRWDALLAWYIECLDAVGMSQEWTPDVSRSPPDDGQAAITMTDCLGAYLQVSAKFWDEPEEKQIDIMAHELTHLFHHRYDQCIEACLEGLDDGQTKIATRIHNSACEHATERVSRLIRPLLPKPRLPR